ncbi:unnamed protein product [Effrenium voratum]|uniref:Uncharacterized protein n=1 Tax=Effrenium voratum TaxID=2562239 RepID=A0AA36JF45_9DINO|nr:unnamed protein product [Effrenium voratum]
MHRTWRSWRRSESDRDTLSCQWMQHVPDLPAVPHLSGSMLSDPSLGITSHSWAELKVLNLHGRQLRRFDADAFQRLHGLETLLLSFNCIESLAVIPACGSLTTLDVAHNLIHKVNALVSFPARGLGILLIFLEETVPLAQISTMVLVTVRGLSGDELLGPVEVDGAETVEALQRRLGALGAGPWRLLQGEKRRAQASQSSLSELSAAAHARAEECERRNAAWLEELPEAAVPRKRQKREEDVEEYERALALLVEQMSSIALARSRVEASKGKATYRYDFQLEAQGFELGDKMYFRCLRDLRCDPVLRGWYFTQNLEDLDAPQRVSMGNTVFYEWVINILRPRMMDHLRQMDLTVKEDVQVCHALTIHWEDPAA